ncbi:uncharacterized protein LOC121887765 isoform X2 [Thunnus maccoyii]|uniref:uncharacterized protein LOC121887765 isoform X2 n=1 Tax=Thunnus maccoyii TaxID=8240 RepID=UPI001C4ACDC1|nr:uncharacterized protein LOC121887765 isoform X2 [Thunnus maccoyii]
MCAGCGQDGLFTSKQELIAQFWGLKTNTEKVGKTGTSDATRSLSSASNHLHHCHISWSQGCEVNQTSGPSTMFSKDVLGSKAQRLIERGLFFEPARVAIVPVGMDVYPYEEWKETSAASVETEEASSDHMIGGMTPAPVLLKEKEVISILRRVNPRKAPGATWAQGNCLERMYHPTGTHLHPAVPQHWFCPPGLENGNHYPSA